MMKRCVFVAGGTGYLGRPLIERLLKRGHEVRALVRAGSERRLPVGCQVIEGNALRPNSYVGQIAPAEVFIQLVGVAHPSPAKGEQFRQVDRTGGLSAVKAAIQSGVRQFVYLSVAYPAPVMKAYIEVRAECEAAICDGGLNATILRPWYVLGPGHRWPYLLVPAYWLMGRLPATRDAALRLGLVTLQQMVNALVTSVEDDRRGIKIMGVPEILAAGSV
jgi:uncharacterized protein YbjT (DUF2867 family)